MIKIIITKFAKSNNNCYWFLWQLATPPMILAGTNPQKRSRGLSEIGSQEPKIDGVIDNGLVCLVSSSFAGTGGEVK
jgi:hypothetical protein